MANVTLPATGTGTTTPVIESINGPASAQRQSVTISDRAGNAVDSVGGLTETAPASDTASSGLNGRLQRIAQRLTSLIALFPKPLTSTNLSGTIAVTDTFQSVQVATAGRNGGSIQNNSSHAMFVYFGPIGSATEAAAFQLPSGGSISCAVGSYGVVTDQVSITGIAGDAFVANFQ